VLIILSKEAASIPTIKPSSTRRINAVSVASIKVYEELETELHAFLTEGGVALPKKWELGWALGLFSTSWRKERFFVPSENQHTNPWSSSPQPSHYTNWAAASCSQLPHSPFLKNGQYSSMSGRLHDWRTIYRGAGSQTDTDGVNSAHNHNGGKTAAGRGVQVFKTLFSGSRSFAKWQEFTHQWR